ncbi:ATP-dependent RNA helicase DbpA [Pseudoxanthomonas sp.]|uniref:ATP-dependent RNA helicase DbpA n=1 Tax=Pseudoxanthomonas sp. TaxID=1871049 RepID=UPI0026071D57|nr:ATP-dependent RNA helicase DbpA [Pseudoxanthomonas sp.]WDS37195.1 MAG: ATP-dependent RNA helicase DbpA [Pseudoxanthomonas sp.]
MEDFSTLPLSDALRRGLDAANYTQPTDIQVRALPPILEGRDVIAQAPTGSGKTAAFALGLLTRIDTGLVKTQALVLCPTRELADQVARAVRRLAVGLPNLKVTLICGGMSLEPQIASLEHDPHVIVGTPGRVQELMRKKALHLNGVRVLVLDEADRMLDMGFEDQIREIVGRTPKTRQSLLFSATWPDAIRAIAQDSLKEPVEVASDETTTVAPAIFQRFCEVEPAMRQKALAGLLLQQRVEPAVVFCNTRKDVDEVANSLQGFGFSALALHGDMEQRDREEVLVRFSGGSCNVLVASDVAARGLDVEDVAAVFNYELPTDTDTYTHRIGRTARAGRSGLAFSLVTPRELPRARALEELAGTPLEWMKTPLATGRPSQPPRAPFVSLRVDGGKKDKLRPGDILGALTGDAGLPGSAIGRIIIGPVRSYVSIKHEQADKAVARLSAGKIKGRSFRVRAI